MNLFHLFTLVKLSVSVAAPITKVLDPHIVDAGYRYYIGEFLADFRSRACLFGVCHILFYDGAAKRDLARHLRTRTMSLRSCKELIY